MRVKSILIALMCCGLPSFAVAHSVLPISGDNEGIDMPRSFWEYFISNAESALTVSIKEQEGYRYLKTNGIADHATGQFPGRGNPHRIIPRDVTYRVPLNPVRSSQKRNVGHASFGIAINGIPFDAATAEYWGGRRGGEWNYEAIEGGMNLGIDQNNAHVQPDGTYHYHALPIGLLEQHPYKRKPVLIGYAADGFPIYSPKGYVNADNPDSGMKDLRPSYRIKSGTRPSGPGGKYDGRFTKDWEYVAGLGDLDACNGRTGVTPEYPDGTYYYVITDGYPHIPRCWVGEADTSFQKSPNRQRGVGGGNREGGFLGGQQRSGMGPGGRQGRRGPPQEALNACNGRADNDRCEFEARHGTISGQCRTVRGGEMACVPEGHRARR